jgi:hypothetical protein
VLALPPAAFLPGVPRLLTAIYPPLRTRDLLHGQGRTGTPRVPSDAVTSGTSINPDALPDPAMTGCDTHECAPAQFFTYNRMVWILKVKHTLPACRYGPQPLPVGRGDHAIKRTAVRIRPARELTGATPWAATRAAAWTEHRNTALGQDNVRRK